MGLFIDDVWIFVIIVVMKKILIKYGIPKSFDFKIHQADGGGYWLDSKDLPGLYTQGETLGKLFENLEDAILTYFDVPRKEARKVGGFINIDAKGLIELSSSRLDQLVAAG